MRSSSMGMGKWAAAAGGALTMSLLSASAWAEDLIGQPTPGAIDFQPGVTDLRHTAIWFHNGLLLPIITAITLFVLFLLLWVIFRFNKRANPIPAKWSHNTPIEIIWTLVPVLILVVIGIFSLKVLYAYHDMPKPDVTIKATGYQWYWGYEYPELKVSEITSTMLSKEKADAAGLPHQLGASEAMVIPTGKVVQVLVTGADVIHAFTVPAFGVKVDAIPGRVNQVWFKVDRPGVYYGQCSELCGVDHAYMPIMVRAVSPMEFNTWVASKGGGPKADGALKPVAPAAAASTTPDSGAPAAADAGTPAAATAPASSATAGVPAAAPSAPANTATH
ncbi:MAG: cytochrome c oxidase subunit II [Caulobacteraceae bacterium]